MSQDFSFVHNSLTQRWIILDPRRSSRPDEGKHTLTPVCPFCPPVKDKVLLQENDITVVKNKFPFAPIHEIIIHSQDHHKNFDELPLEQVISIFRVYRERYLLHKEKGTVYIFHNHGEMAGESLPHPHSQLVVIPKTINLEISPLVNIDGVKYSTRFFDIFCPKTSEWPDEVWIRLIDNNKTFGDITEQELTNLAKTTQRVIQLLDLRHGQEFPFNFYIYPWHNWYLRIIPRQRRLGGFEVGTGVSVNTQDPAETIAFIKEHFEKEDREKIKMQQAQYHRGV